MNVFFLLILSWIPSLLFLFVGMLPKIAGLMVVGVASWQIRKPGMYWGTIWGHPNYQQWATKPSNDASNFLFQISFFLFQIYFSFGWNSIILHCWVNNHPDVWSVAELSFFPSDICSNFWPHEYNTWSNIFFLADIKLFCAKSWVKQIPSDICPNFWPHEYNPWSDSCLQSLVKNIRTLANKLSASSSTTTAPHSGGKCIFAAKTYVVYISPVYMRAPIGNLNPFGA